MPLRAVGATNVLVVVLANVSGTAHLAQVERVYATRVSALVMNHAFRETTVVREECDHVSGP